MAIPGGSQRTPEGSYRRGNLACIRADGTTHFTLLFEQLDIIESKYYSILMSRLTDHHHREKNCGGTD